MIIKPTVRWGIWGASLCLATYGLVFALETFFTDSKPIWLIYRVIDYPMRLVWSASGLLQDDALRWSTLSDVSSFLFSAIFGFGIGALIRRLFVRNDYA
jgi:hypothetical protein